MDYGALDYLIIRAPIAVLEVALKFVPYSPSAGGEVSHLKPQKQNGSKTAAQLWGYRFNCLFTGATEARWAASKQPFFRAFL